MTTKPRRLTPIEFVTAWQRSRSIPDLIAKTGIRENAARGRATRYRRKGIPLKKLADGRASIDVAALKALVEKLAKEDPQP